MGSAYGPEYYQHGCGLPYNREEPHWFKFFGHIADEIVSRIGPRRVLDVGCAKGFLVEALRDRGVEAFGFDISDYAISQVREDTRRYCRVADLAEGICGHYDLITCIEVLEHVAEEQGRAAIRSMAAHADSVLFSSTPTDFSEPTHVNVRPVLYWLREFREAGFAPDLNFDAGFVSAQAFLLRRSSARLTDEVLELFARNRDLTIELEAARNEAAKRGNLWAEALQSSEQEVESLRSRDKHIMTLRAELERLQRAHAETAQDGESYREEAECLLSELDLLVAERHETQAVQRELAGANEELQRSNSELENVKQKLSSIENSLGWRLLNAFRSRRDRVLPIGTRRRRVHDLGIAAAKFTRTYGVGALGRKIRERVSISLHQPAKLYRRWIELNEPGPEELARMQRRAAAFAYRPLVSIVTPVYNSNIEELRACIESVRKQVYTNWELCLCDDASTKKRVRSVLLEYEQRDARIKVKYSDMNRGIALASNKAMALATGEFVGLLDHDDELSPNALYEVVDRLQARRDIDIFYSDEDKLDARGTRLEPYFKPDWSPELLRCCMYTCHFTVYRKSLLDRVGGFRAGFDGSQDYDLMLRASELTKNIVHVPKVLYHWRKAAGSAAGSSYAKPYAYAAARHALADHLKRRGIPGEVVNGVWPGQYRVKYPISPERVSIIVPTRDKAAVLRKCIESIEKQTDYPDYEIVIVDNDSSEPEAKAYLANSRHKVIPFSEPFNFSRMNNVAAKEATGRYLLFLNNDTEVVSPDWISAMVEFAQQEDIGVVGAKLLYPNGTIQHIGVTVGLGGVAGHPLTGFHANSPYYFGLTGQIRNTSAVTAACMLVCRDVFEKVGGFDEQIRVAFNDVDFCLRVVKAGYRIVITPYAQLYHHESASRGYVLDDGEINLMKERWGAALLEDPYYNPNLTLQSPDYALRF